MLMASGKPVNGVVLFENGGKTPSETVTRKIGFNVSTASAYVGQVEVAGIGAPRELISEVASERA